MSKNINRKIKHNMMKEHLNINLPLARYRIRLRALSKITFHDYSGSAWRGLFGHVLKRSVCITREKSCKQCLLYRNCVYSWVFETPPPADAEHMRLYSAVPHPFVLTPDPDLRELKPGETTTLSLTLIGKANQHLPYIVHTFTQAGKQGIGPANGQFEVCEITQELVPGSGEWQDIFAQNSLQALPPAVPEVPQLSSNVVLEIQTPTRLKYNNRLMNPERFEAAGIISNLLRRTSSLCYFHGDGELQADYKALTETARKIEASHTELNWYDWTRFSSRQQQKMQMGGLLGTAEFAAEDIAPFWSLLWTGQWLHLGKATSMGLGRYRLREIQQIKDQAA